MNWKDYFQMMIDWKKLPAYKAEPRIDSLIGYYLKPILEDYLKAGIEGIIPELPIRLGTVRPEHEGTNYADRSYKVDFFAIGEYHINYLIEFKTDSGSRRDNQDKYLIQAKSVSTEKLINGIQQIAKVSTYKEKYNHLLNKLREYGFIDNREHYTGKNQGLEIIYVQPSKKDKEENVIDFIWIADWLEKTYKNEIFESEFARALRTWSKD